MDWPLSEVHEFVTSAFLRDPEIVGELLPSEFGVYVLIRCLKAINCHALEDILKKIYENIEVLKTLPWGNKIYAKLTALFPQLKANSLNSRSAQKGKY